MFVFCSLKNIDFIDKINGCQIRIDMIGLIQLTNERTNYAN